MKQTPHVSVIIVGWNSAKDLRDCLSSVTNQSYLNYNIIFVDNDSQDNTIDLIEAEFPDIDLLPLKHNTFFTGGNNAGYVYAKEKYASDFYALLNPDTIVESNWLSCQVAKMQKHSDVGVVGGKVLFAPGHAQVKQTDANVINTAGILPGGFLFPYDRGYGETDHGQFDTDEEVYAVSGVSMLIRGEAIKDNRLFSEVFQMYLEDVDLCLQIQHNGYTCLYTSCTSILHKHMQSTSQHKSDRYLFWSNRNYLLLVWKWYTFKKFLRALSEVSKNTPIWLSIRIVSSACAILIKNGFSKSL